MRHAVLVHAGSVARAAFERLAEHLGEEEPPALVRALADWTRPEVEGWLPLLRRRGIAMRHHFRTRESHDPLLAALAVETLTLASDADLEHVYLVGDVGGATPLVDRLRELGVRVTAVGPARTPHDFRSACDDFWDLAEFETDGGHRDVGRHRAQ
ncbi:NYN domain-containing protein [Nocardioides coralli]|uniref:NYN domain-containing protein n=1 Tax=Nocardioides coralli TaxID=2872154 RepID=UPI001CA461F1|nr:NYN domain-containing protein [Nocardioides coralli]QZY29074.1 NYN domain-containing protein [Nocardioides coralli]